MDEAKQSTAAAVSNNHHPRGGGSYYSRDQSPHLRFRDMAHLFSGTQTKTASLQTKQEQLLLVIPDSSHHDTSNPVERKHTHLKSKDEIANAVARWKAPSTTGQLKNLICKLTDITATSSLLDYSSAHTVKHSSRATKNRNQSVNSSDAKHQISSSVTGFGEIVKSQSSHIEAAHFNFERHTDLASRVKTPQHHQISRPVTCQEMSPFQKLKREMIYRIQNKQNIGDQLRFLRTGKHE